MHNQNAQSTTSGFKNNADNNMLVAWQFKLNVSP